MILFAWMFAAATAFAPTNFLTLSAQAFEAQCATVEAIAVPLLMPEWMDDDF